MNGFIMSNSTLVELIKLAFYLYSLLSVFINRRDPAPAAPHVTKYMNKRRFGRSAEPGLVL